MMKTIEGALNRRDRLPRMRVAREMRNWLEEGEFISGEMLPTEEILCERLNVSRGTIRAALKQLESEGLLQGQKGRGRIRGRIVAPRAGVRNSLMSKTIVLLTNVVEPQQHMHGGLLEVIDSGAADGVHEAGMHLFVLHPDALSNADMVRLLADPPAGIAVGPVVADYAPNREVLLQLVGKIPMVVNGADQIWTSCDRIISDHAQGAYELTRWLIGKGKKRILRAWAPSDDHYWVRERNRGHDQAMAEAGLTALPSVQIKGVKQTDIPSREMFDIHVRQMAGYLVEYLGGGGVIDAIMAASDWEAYWASSCLRLFGITPNKDIWIVGYDHAAEILERKWEPEGPVATMDKLNHALGEEMIHLLLERIHGKLPVQPQYKILAPQLVTFRS
jgi:DNA-binding LacI/PurR family transcriptional regulator